MRALPLLFALAAPAGMAEAHPHVFIDTGVDFIFDDAGLLQGLRVTWIYDPLTSLLMLEDLGIAASGSDALAPDERARLAAYQTEWAEDFEGDSYLYDGTRHIALSGPLEPEGALRDGRVSIGFVRAVASPFRPGDATVVKVYDPTYFSAYVVTEPPRLEGEADSCKARVEPFEAGGPLLALQQSLLSIGADEDPEQPVGALFADVVHVSCD